MVNRLSKLADFLDSDSLPVWLKEELQAKQSEMFAALENGNEFLVSGPNGEQVRIVPQPVAA